MNQEVILIGSKGLGKGDDVLGELIMANFLRLLSETKEKPHYLICWNSGVQLLLSESKAFPYLKAIDAQDTRILACLTCCEYFGIENSVEIGEIVGMSQIQEILLANQVLTL